MHTNECWNCRGTVPDVPVDVLLTQGLQTPEPLAIAHAHAVPGASGPIDHVSMDCDCRGQNLPIRNGA